MTTEKPLALPFTERLRGQRLPLVASHRGSAAGHIIQGTIPAFQAALLQGADLIEIDVIRSRDGGLFIFHDTMERMYLGTTTNIQELSSDEILRSGLYNSNDNCTSQRVLTLEEALEWLKGKALVNLDRGWDHWEQIMPVVDRFRMADQVLLKSPPKPQYLSQLQGFPTKYQYMPILRTKEEFHLVLGYDINLVAAELVFETAESPLVQPDFLAFLKQNKVLPWCNSLKLNDADKICADYDDNVSILEGPEHGWGKLLDLGFDIIQTDWPSLLRDFLVERVISHGQ